MYRKGMVNGMPSRMERYYQANEVKRRTTKNQDLYRTIYDEAEYSNVEGISVIEKNEKIDINMIRELINGTSNTSKVKEEKKVYQQPIIEEKEEERNYDIRDVLEQAKQERPEKEKKFSNTQYNILKGINLNETMSAPKNVDDDDLKNMIEAITVNSKGGYTSDLLDDLKSIHDPKMQDLIYEQIEKEKVDSKDSEEMEIDKSFYTSSLGFTNDDFEDLKDMKDSIKTNNILTKILIFILLVVLITGIIFLVFHFTK